MKDGNADGFEVSTAFTCRVSDKPCQVNIREGQSKHRSCRRSHNKGWKLADKSWSCFQLACYGSVRAPSAAECWPVHKRMHIALYKQTGQGSVKISCLRIFINCAAWKSNKYLQYSECVFVALGIQHATGMCHIFICGLSGSTLFFHIISQRARYWTKKIVEYKTCVLIFYTNLSEIFHSLRRTERDMIKNVCWCSCKVSVILTGL